jgi:cell division protein FtsX
MLKNLLNGAKRHSMLLVGGVVGALSLSFGAALAGATATYDITPVTDSITSELTANLPVILGIIGAIIALTIAVRAVRKFVHV